jgi:hypothetical protein
MLVVLEFLDGWAAKKNRYELRRYCGDLQRVPRRVIVSAESYPHDAFDGWQAIQNESAVKRSRHWARVWPQRASATALERKSLPLAWCQLRRHRPDWLTAAVISLSQYRFDREQEVETIATAGKPNGLRWDAAPTKIESLTAATHEHSFQAGVW